MAYSKAKF